jgi:hypothetical protein
METSMSASRPLIAIGTALLLAASAASTPRDVAAQDVVEAITDVLEWLDEGYELIPESGQWGLEGC